MAAATIDVGTIARPHGVRGWLKAQVHWSESDALLDVERVLVGSAGSEPRWYTIEQASRAGKGVLLKLSGIDDRDAAELLRGASLSVSRTELEPLEEGEFYLCDLVGAKVSVAGAAYGQVVEVRTHPTIDTVVIRTESGESVEQPLVAPWLVRVDAARGEIELSSTDGVIT